MFQRHGEEVDVSSTLTVENKQSIFQFSFCFSLAAITRRIIYSPHFSVHVSFTSFTREIQKSHSHQDVAEDKNEMTLDGNAAEEKAVQLLIKTLVDGRK